MVGAVDYRAEQEGRLSRLFQNTALISDFAETGLAGLEALLN